MGQMDKNNEFDLKKLLILFSVLSVIGVLGAVLELAPKEDQGIVALGVASCISLMILYLVFEARQRILDGVIATGKGIVDLICAIPAFITAIPGFVSALTKELGNLADFLFKAALVLGVIGGNLVVKKPKAPQVVKPARPLFFWLLDLGSNQGPTD